MATLLTSLNPETTPTSKSTAQRHRVAAAAMAIVTVATGCISTSQRPNLGASGVPIQQDELNSATATIHHSEAATTQPTSTQALWDRPRNNRNNWQTIPYNQICPNSATAEWMNGVLMCRDNENFTAYPPNGRYYPSQGGQWPCKFSDSLYEYQNYGCRASNDQCPADMPLATQQSIQRRPGDYSNYTFCRRDYSKPNSPSIPGGGSYPFPFPPTVPQIPWPFPPTTPPGGYASFDIKNTCVTRDVLWPALPDKTGYKETSCVLTDVGIGTGQHAWCTTGPDRIALEVNRQCFPYDPNNPVSHNNAYNQAATIYNMCSANIPGCCLSR